MTTQQEAQSPSPSPKRDSATVLGLNNVDKQLDLIQRLMERGNAFISHPLASGTIDQTEEAGELLHEAAKALTGLAGENAALKREAHTWSKAAETYAADAERLRSMAAPTVKDSLTVAAVEREAFDHSIGEGRFQAVRGSFWWHINIGDSTALHGKFHSKLAAEDMALKMLTAFRDGAWTAWRARAASAPAAHGWQLVPVEPTEEMCAAAVKYANGNAVYKNVKAEVLKIEESIYGEAYQAMLAAAPKDQP